VGVLREDILQMSRGVAIILQLLFSAYLNFQILSQAQNYDGPMNGSRLYGRSPNTDDQSNNSEPVSKVKNVMGFRRRQTKNSDIQDAKRIEMEARTSSDAVSNDARTRLENGNNGMVAMELEAEQPQMSFVMSLVLITIVVTLMTFTAEYFVNSIDGVTAGRLNKRFIGLILFPIVGNATKHIMSKERLEVSIQTAVGSSIQLALLVIPLLVTVGWPIGKPFAMLFDPFESATLFLTVLTVNYIVVDGKTGWLEGVLLMGLYVIVAVSFWFYNPISTLTSTILICN